MKDLIFVSAHSGKTKTDGREYALVTLSNGLRAFTVDNKKRVDVSGLKEGDRVKAEFDFDVDYKNNLRLVLMSLVKLK